MQAVNLDHSVENTLLPQGKYYKRGWQEGIPSERHWKHGASRKRFLNLAKYPRVNTYLCQT